MPATLETIIRRARLDFGDEDNADIVNEYLRKVASYLNPLFHWVTTTSVANQQAYYITQNFPIEEVIWNTGSSASILRRITTEDLRVRGIDWANTDSSNCGTPECWIPDYGVATTGKFGFLLYPIPDTSGVTIQYREGYGGASLAVDADVCPMPDVAIDAVVKGCQYERALRNEPEKANLIFSAWTRSLQEAVFLLSVNNGQRRLRGDSL